MLCYDGDWVGYGMVVVGVSACQSKRSGSTQAVFVCALFMLGEKKSVHEVMCYLEAQLIVAQASSLTNLTTHTPSTTSLEIEVVVT
ncbi:hypothetical protein E2C01_011321 [Portunus trituberculatus]|uniref:Uncharacterized protein n=1 Tax=Portunus trituberculatus TaxID=210409 RepID=A0A5B7DBE2_PORTR|nr:hypothetical protein [Portunus trituberculatus]